ncbi:MAG: hypothetical protein IPG64_07880 [Haliea sp.]|nr:hypothetical protein [Haliea sp.]
MDSLGSEGLYSQGFFSLSGANNTFIDSDYAYVASSFDGAAIIDASDVSEPVTVWKIQPDNFGSRDNFTDVIVTGNLAIFIAYPGCGGWCQGTFKSIAQVYEITNPAEPVLMDDFELNASSLGADENFLYAAISADGGAEPVPQLRIIDLSNPASADTVGSIEISGGGQLAVQGQIAFVSFNGFRNFNGIDAVNIADPNKPVLLGDLVSAPVNVPHAPIALSGNTAYIADRNNGVQVVDISDPLNTQLLANIPTTSEANDVAVAEGYLYVAQGIEGVAIYDIDIPTDPEFVQYIETPAAALSITVSERIGAVSVDWVLEEDNGQIARSIIELHKLLLFLTH